MPKPISNKPGNASIEKQGHTTTGQHGQSPTLPGKRTKPRDLGVKSGK
jgi:hypothetical protein